MKPELHALVGMRHRGTEGLVRVLPAGEPLELRREKDNPVDTWAIQVWARGQHVGFVAGERNGSPAARLDAGEKLKARLYRSAPGRWPLVEITTEGDHDEAETTA